LSFIRKGLGSATPLDKGEDQQEEVYRASASSPPVEGGPEPREGFLTSQVDRLRTLRCAETFEFLVSYPIASLLEALTMKFLKHFLLTSGMGISLLSGCEKYSLDKQMAEPCAKDGGIRVFETVQLPQEMFDQNGYPFPGWRQRPEEQRLGPDYELKETEMVLKQDDPLHGEGRLVKHEWVITRKSDGKQLGQAVVFGRSGGDFIVADHFTTKACPEQLGLPGKFIQEVFRKIDG